MIKKHKSQIGGIYRDIDLMIMELYPIMQNSPKIGLDIILKPMLQKLIEMKSYFALTYKEQSDKENKYKLVCNLEFSYREFISYFGIAEELKLIPNNKKISSYTLIDKLDTGINNWKNSINLNQEKPQIRASLEDSTVANNKVLKGENGIIYTSSGNFS